MTGVMPMGGRFPTFVPASPHVLSAGASVEGHVAAGAVSLPRLCPGERAT